MSRTFLICTLILVSLSSAGWAQEELWYYPPVTLDQATSDRLWKAHDYTELGRFDEAIEIYLDIAAQHQGQALGVDSLTQAMFVAKRRGDKVQFETLRQRLRDEYPDSFERITADLRSVQFRVSREEFETAYSDVLERDYGAPRPDDIMAGRDPEGAVRKALALHPETRLGIMSTYYTICWKLINEKRWDEAIRLTTFGREAFDTHPYSDARFTGNLDAILRRQTGDRTINTQRSEPTLTVLSPAPGAIVGTQPNIVVRLTSGDYRKARISMTSLVFKVDGVNHALHANIDSAINTSLQAGVDFEVLTVSYQPTLSPGSHTVEVQARGLPVPNSPPDVLPLVTQTWSFTVSDNPPPPPPTDQTLPVSKDSILSQQNPHRNEGANDLLQLSHRPEEKNKSNNPIIAFNLANVNLTGLRKARLVLNIQECEQPKKWGPEGRNILAYPVNEEWVEGNGETIKAGQGEKTRGTGQGVTWFSPIDENIANKAPNGALQWSGARPFLGPLTAPPVLITNKQVGTIELDVTQDVKSGFTDGWLVRKQDEAAFGNVRFYSKEGAAGNQALAPKLILE